MITQVTNRLPAEKRKAYLFKPVANLTYESMIETILGKDGITPEMIKAQQERLEPRRQAAGGQRRRTCAAS